MNFSSQRVMDAVWPEVTGVVAYGLGALGAAYVDTYMADEGAPAGLMAQNVYTWGTLLAVGPFFIGTGRNVDFGKGLMFGAGVGVLLNGMRYLYDKAQEGVGTTGVKLNTLGVLIPRAYGRQAAAPAQITQANLTQPVGSSGKLVRGMY